MLSRTLVFTADENVSGILQQALVGMRREVRHSKEIFSAVEQITRESFQLLVIDWQEELEASFLLKTARDLKWNRAVFAVAIVAAVQGREALENGADAILVKPFTAQQAEEVLFSRMGEGPQPRNSGTHKSEPDSTTVTQPEPARSAVQTVKPHLEFAQVKSIGEPWQNRARKTESSPRPVPVPIDRTRSKLSRTLSITAVMWPVIIAAALLAFDQWPHLPRRGLALVSGLFAAAQARVSTLPSLGFGPSVLSAAKEQVAENRPPIPVIDDLLADYTTPAAPSQIPLSESSVPQKVLGIDPASVEALPTSRRFIAPALTIEHSGSSPEIPSSLRFPPPTQSSSLVVPKGNLVVPDWPQGSIALPETVSRGLLERQVEPRYPEPASRAGVDGTVVLEASIARDGTIRDLKLVSGYLILARAAFDAVKQWRYKPYRHNGENVEVETVITVDFKRPPRG
jgi:TonB family protein